MKTKYPSMFGILAIFLLVASFVVPANMANPAPVEATDAICQWDVVDTPGIVSPLKVDIAAGQEIDKLVVASDGLTMWVVDPNTASTVSIRRTTNGGITWSGSATVQTYLSNALTGDDALPAWNVAVAPDDPKFVVAVVSDNATGVGHGPSAVYVTQDGGANWQDTDFTGGATTFVAGTDFISCVDISMNYGATRDILVGTRDGTGTGSLYVLKAPGFTAWTDQLLTEDVYAAKFSPTYVGDAAIVAVSSGGATTTVDVNIGIRDLAVSPPTTDWAVVTNFPVEVLGPSGVVGSSDPAKVITADLELPSDFSGATASLRRMYVSLDASGMLNIDQTTGIFRFDNTTPYVLMDTTSTFDAKRISSIAYYGTYASGKLLAGEVEGDSCTATVPTWFTDSPTTCPIPCWYPALKPTTGATGVTCNTDPAYGNAQVVWRPDGVIAYVGTGSADFLVGGTDITDASTEWPEALLNSETYDESAFGLSRNNGETWNQLSLIDTYIAEFTDVAPAADCSTVYLASTNNQTACNGFDSVWRSSTNAAVVFPPLPPLPIGTIWERVLCHVTAKLCTDTQSDHAILRLAPDKTDGQIVFWAADGTAVEDVAVLWTPDYGDYWANINPRIAVQDMAAASSTLLYILNTSGWVQKMPYTGTAWSSAENSVDAGILGHTIAAYGADWVLVGDAGPYSTLAPVAYSSNAAVSFSSPAVPTGNNIGHVHVAFDPDFDNNSIIYAAYDDAAGSIYRWAIGTSSQWDDLLGVGAYGTNHQIGYYGLALAHTGGALYGAHNSSDTINDGVERTLTPTSGMPKPGMFWDCLNIFRGATTTANAFNEEPSSLKLCGCLTMDTDTNLWAIDNNTYNPWDLGYTFYRDPGHGLLWMFTDCVAKNGPALTMEDGLLVGCDPVSGRNQEINFTWEQLCIAGGYDIEIAKDTNFTMKVFDWMSGAATATLTPGSANLVYSPDAITSPTMIFPVAGGSGASVWGASAPKLISLLECGHSYYWRVAVRACVTTQLITSPWSEVRSFTVKAGLPVSADYYGLKLLSPDNGCIACSVSPASFSWSPFKGTTKYKFVLAKDAALTDVLAEAETATTAYEYDGTLDYSTNYFWRVMCVEPAPSDWSATFSFQTEAAPAAPEGPPAAPATPMWVWIIIALGAILVIVTLVLIFKTRRV